MLLQLMVRPALAAQVARAGLPPWSNGTVWSRSHCSAGRRQGGNRHVLSRAVTSSATRAAAGTPAYARSWAHPPDRRSRDSRVAAASAARRAAARARRMITPSSTTSAASPVSVALAASAVSAVSAHGVTAGGGPWASSSAATAGGGIWASSSARTTSVTRRTRPTPGVRPRAPGLRDRGTWRDRDRLTCGVHDDDAPSGQRMLSGENGQLPCLTGRDHAEPGQLPGRRRGARERR